VCWRSHSITSPARDQVRSRRFSSGSAWVWRRRGRRTSMEISAVGLRAKRVRSAARMRPTSGGGTSDGVPPPKNTVDSGAAPTAVCARHLRNHQHLRYSRLYPENDGVVNCLMLLMCLGFGKPPPRKQSQGSHFWILKCLQGGRARPLAACGLATLCCSPLEAAGNRNPSGTGGVHTPRWRGSLGTRRPRTSPSARASGRGCCLPSPRWRNHSNDTAACTRPGLLLGFRFPSAARSSSRCHTTDRERMSSPTLYTLQDPILLLPWLCLDRAAFQTLAKP
jgi:hypothetical protein